MSINDYLRLLDVQGKSFAFLAIAPKGKYPLRSYGNEFDNYVKQVISIDKYISIYDYQNNRPEILQDVAFKMLIMPLIGDTNNMIKRETIKEKRATKEQMEAFIVAKEFYATVPNGEKSEEEAIENGKAKAKAFIDKYANGEYEVVIKNVSRHEDGVQFLYEMEFNKSNEDYVFDYCYCN